MKHFELIKEFTSIPGSHQWDLYYDLLTEDFHFKSTLNEVKGKNNYIEFEKFRSMPIKEETYYIFSNLDETEYYRVFHLSYSSKVDISLLIHETIGVKNGLICHCYLNTLNMPSKMPKEFSPIVDYKLKAT